MDIKITDFGHAFEPTSVSILDITASGGYDEIGGFGLNFIYQIRQLRNWSSGKPPDLGEEAAPMMITKLSVKSPKQGRELILFAGINRSHGGYT